MNRPVQYFSDEYLEQCKKMTPNQIVRFLEDFRLMQSRSSAKKKLISIRISEPLLLATKKKAQAMGIAYQTQIQKLIEAWVTTVDL